MPVKPSTTHEGGCLCGAVRYTVSGPLRNLVVCHCEVCRKVHGGPAPHSACERDDLRITGESALRWHSLDGAQRGFCDQCGSRLFWDRGFDTISICAGSLDEPTGLHIDQHIFVASAAAWEEPADGLPGSGRVAR